MPELVKEITTTKFDASVDVDVRLGVDPRKANQMVRGVVSLPNGTGKTVRVLALCTPDQEEAAKAAGADYAGLDEYIEKIKGGWTDVDVIITMPSCMGKVGPLGRFLGPRVSSSLTSGLTADCTELEIGDYDDKKSGKHYEGLLYQIRPAFGGNIVATIVNPDHRPQMATVRSGVMQKSIYEGECKKEVVYPEVSKYVPAEDFVVKVLDHHVEAAKHNLKGSAIVVAGGYGVGSKEGFDQLFELAHLLHGEVGASRAAVDAGWVDHDRQIGQTGVTVHPKVYIACGISGQIQHIAGMQDSGIIISVNNDPDAPINKIADYVINGNVEDVVPKLIKYYKQNSK